MSERERWIVYPLLMFALGAAVRDKLMQRVESKEIRCESLQIVDHQDPDRPLAKLSFKPGINNDPTQLPDRVGMLQLFDSKGKPACEIAMDAIIFGRIITPQLRVIDPSLTPRVVVGTELTPALSLDQGVGAYSYQGVIYLNNQPLVGRIGPPVNRPAPNQQQPPAAEPPASSPPAEIPVEETTPPAENPV
jgi:hypothetical protein